MGFLDPGAEAPDRKEPQFGGFLSDNPPPTVEQPKEKPVPGDWMDVGKQALVNVPESAYEYGKNIVHPIMHPVDTMESLGNLYMGMMQKAGLMPTPESERKAGRPEGTEQGGDFRKYPDAVGQMLVDRYGSIDNVKRTLANDPVGALGDASMILTGGGSATSRLPGIAGKVGEAVKTAGAITDPLTPVTKAAGLAGKGAAMTLGYDTGAGMRAIEEAAKAGYEGGDAAKTFNKYQSGAGTPEEFINYATQAKQNLLKERGLDYETGMIPVKNSNQILSFADIGQAMTDAHKITKYKGVDVNLNPGVQNALQRLDDQIIKWVQLNPADFHTPIGFDALKKSLDSIAKEFKPGTPENFAASKYVKAVDNTIRKQVPEYGKVMKDYAEFSDEIRQIESTFSLPRDQRKAVVDTALRKMQSLFRRNVNTNFGQRERLADVLEASGAPHLKAAIAGMGLSSPEAHGLVRIIPALKSMNWKSVWDAAGSLGVSSPLIAGRAAFNAGRLARPIKYIPKGTTEGLRQAGRYDEYMHQARGGAVDRAIRTARKR